MRCESSRKKSRLHTEIIQCHNDLATVCLGLLLHVTYLTQRAEADRHQLQNSSHMDET